MLVLLGALLTLAASSVAVPCPDYCVVVSGVFQPKVTVNFSDAQLVCGCYKAELANLEQVTRAYNHSYESCSWGWVKEQKMVMLRNTVNEKCGNSTGVLQRTPCVHIEAQSGICFKRNVTHSGLYPVSPPRASQLLTKAEANSLCVALLGHLATKEEITTSNRSTLPLGLTAWYQDGIIKQNANGTMEEAPCVNYPQVNASVFCYSAGLKDAVCVDNTWKNILMGCILASIFAILLIAAACMRGNQFICCLDKSHSGTVGNSNEVGRVTARVPTWNTTSIYTPVVDVIDPVYSNSVNMLPEPRLPAIRPEMLNYRSHLSYVIPRPALPAIPTGQSRVYDNLGYDASGEQ